MGQEPITAAQRLEYQSNVQLALQQKTSRLKMCATYQPNLKGKKVQIVELFGPEQGQFDLPRNASVQVGDITSEQVWCKPRRLNTIPKLLEKEDEIKNATNYSGSIVQSNAATLARMEDQVLADALWAARIIGEDGTASAAYSNPNGYVANNYVPSGAAAITGLKVYKLVKGLELLERAEVDVEMEEIYLQVTSGQMTDLYNDLMFTNKDYRDRAVIDEARKLVRELLNVKIIRMPDAYVRKVATERRCMLFAKSGLHYGEFSPVEATMDRSIAHYNRVMMFSEEWVGATRSEDEKFVPIDCTEA